MTYLIVYQLKIRTGANETVIILRYAYMRTLLSLKCWLFYCHSRVCRDK